MHDFWDKVWSMQFGAALAGAVAGGAASIAGAWIQSFFSNRTSQETLAKGSATTAYEALGTIRELMAGKSFIGAGTSEARIEWNRERTVLVLRAMAAANLLPKSQDQRRTQARKAMKLIQDWDGLTRWSDHEAATQILISEAMEQLGTFVQGEEAPPVRDVEAVVRQELERRRRERLISRLKELEQEGERDGLEDADDVEEANRIKAELGVQHSRELTSPDTPQIAS
ncbi:hypothetical protein [Streptomyces sp. NBC_00343]|uniref:hypothetical protein n=1 Tax=Streptomyces sp. NBC_00343 TaxID=2975719 RepID=UPI002E2B4751|nr:hypothetical protein [Streptomyces sp. NBC_00343]